MMHFHELVFYLCANFNEALATPAQTVTKHRVKPNHQEMRSGPVRPLDVLLG